MPNKLSRFWLELKRRKVIRVFVAYVAVGFAIIEFVDIVAEPLALPSWILLFSIILISAGLPMAIILAWAFGKDPTLSTIINANGNTGIKDDYAFQSDSADTRKNSIVILPFEDMSAEKDQDYFCDGIAEEIINALTKIENLHVMARTSAFAFKGQNRDVREIGKKLGVETLLEGSVRKSGKHVRITAQLINIDDGYHLWSERFDRDLLDIFEIQDEISMQIVNKLKISIKPGEEEKLAAPYTSDFQAYNLYLEGRYHWNRLTEDGITKGMEFFEKAIQKDPGYGPAYSGIADSYCRKAWYAYVSPQDAFPKARKAAEKAIALDKNLAESYASLGFISMCFDRKYRKAEEEMRKAVQLNPGYACAHSYLSICLAVTGRYSEAIDEGKKALELDPLTPMMYINLAARYYYARQYDLCLETVQKVLVTNPEFIFARYYLAYFYNQKQMHSEALLEIQKVLDALGRKNPQFLAALGMILAYKNDTKGAEEVINEINVLSKQKYISLFWHAMVYLALDRRDEAFEWFEKAEKTHDCMMIFLRADPVFDTVRKDPRYKRLLMKMNLTE